MAFEFKLPDIGEGVVEGEIVRWMVKPGDPVTEDQPMVEIMTDKATVEIPSPRRGYISAIHGGAGEVVKVGATLVVIEEESGAAPSAAVQPSESVVSVAPMPAAVQEPPHAIPTAPAPQSAPPPIPPAPPLPPPRPSVAARKPGERVLASPSTRKLARELGMDIETIAGTGPRGRVTHEDVKAASQARLAMKAPVSTALLEERIPLRAMRKRIAEKMSRSKHTAAHFAYVDDADVSELVRLRDAAESQAVERGLKLTYLPFIVKAVVLALKKYPMMNASLDDAREEIVLKKYYNIGIAVATEAGLIVPVVKNADQKSVFQLAAEIQQLAQAAREGKSKLDDLHGGTFTITSLGAVGGLMATPIINHPEVAILGLHKIEPRPVVRDGAVVIRKMMNLSISLDHRIVDGYVAALFIQEIIRYLQQPGLLFLDQL
jgi:pyruvate dehydrogenase E2 component (dihydrolipoamide acetyltransferase)